MSMLDLQNLKQHFPKLDYRNELVQYIDELSINTTSILIMLDNIEGAQ